MATRKTPVKTKSSAKSKARPQDPKYPAPSATNSEILQVDDGVIGYSPTQTLAELQGRFAAGDKSAILAAVYVFAHGHVDIDGREQPMPAWVRDGFIAAYTQVLFGKAKDWNDVFDKPHLKGKQVPARQRRIQFAGRVRREVEKAKKRGKGIGRPLFDEIGESLGVSGGTVERYYYEK